MCPLYQDLHFSCLLKPPEVVALSRLFLWHRNFILKLLEAWRHVLCMNKSVRVLVLDRRWIHTQMALITIQVPRQTLMIFKVSDSFRGSISMLNKLVLSRFCLLNFRSTHALETYILWTSWGRCIMLHPHFKREHFPNYYRAYRFLIWTDS